MDFSVSRRSTMKPGGRKKPMGTTVGAVEFADSKPTFAARKKKVGTIVNADSFNLARKRTGTLAAKDIKKPIFDESDEDD